MSEDWENFEPVEKRIERDNELAALRASYTELQKWYDETRAELSQLRRDYLGLSSALGQAKQERDDARAELAVSKQK